MVKKIMIFLKTKKTFLLIPLFLLFFSTLQNVSAGECEYGTINAGFSKDGATWQNATVNHINYSCGEPFFVKATIKPKIDLISIDIKIWETGESNKQDSTFELLEGPNCFFTYFDIYPVNKNDVFTYFWKFRVKPDTDWVNGNAPLNLHVQFDKNDNDNKDITFTIVNMYIQDVMWEGYIENHDDQSLGQNMPEKNNSPGYEFFLLIILIFFIAIYNRKKNVF